MAEKCLIFYSWQSDIKESRNFISNCMKQLAQKCKNIMPIEVSRDTQGLSGAPNIGDAIYEKIDNADIFVADVSIINPDAEGRKTPNPNVMIELGYAIKALGWEHIVLLYNSDCGEVEELPFDINHQRMLGYSLQDTKKSEERDKVIRSIANTISILKAKGEIHGGQTQLICARRELSGILWRALGRIKADFEERHWCDNGGNIEYIPITDAVLAKVELLRDQLNDEQTDELLILLTKLQYAISGTDEANGWEFAEEVAKRCFDDVYIEYGEKMSPLALEQILNPETIDLLNAINHEKQIEFLAERSCDGKTIFVNDGRVHKACDISGNLLCDGIVTETGFTGFKCTMEYEGYLVDDKWHGQGRERSCILGCKRFGYGKYRKEGRWENGRFVEGKVFSAVLYKENGNYVYEQDGEDDILTADSSTMPAFLNSLEDDEVLYLADLTLHDGKYEVVEESVRILSSDCTVE